MDEPRLAVLFSRLPLEVTTRVLEALDEARFVPGPESGYEAAIRIANYACQPEEKK